MAMENPGGLVQFAAKILELFVWDITNYSLGLRFLWIFLAFSQLGNPLERS
jgi:hypothetical protein